jgi:hypothetical protein
MMPKRFTTQMYLYLLPLSSRSATDETRTVVPAPTHDGGKEHTAAEFADAATWLARARADQICLYPPQLYLLTLVAEAFASVPPQPGLAAAQREALYAFLRKVPTSEGADGQQQLAADEESLRMKCAAVSWADKTISPRFLGYLPGSDGRSVMALDDAGREMRGTGRAGDADRVAILRFHRDRPPQEGEIWPKMKAVALIGKSAVAKGDEKIGKL